MKRPLMALLGAPLALVMASCLNGNDPDDYSEWYRRNETFIDSVRNALSGKDLEYTKITPDWAPGTYVLMKWHNDTLLTRKNLSPLNNSTVLVKYQLRDIDAKVLDSSYSMTTYRDSLYRTRVNNVITGWQIALTNMHEGDSVTVVVPYNAAYGSTGSGAIAPYSTLIFDVMLKKVQAYETPF